MFSSPRLTEFRKSCLSPSLPIYKSYDSKTLMMLKTIKGKGYFI